MLLNALCSELGDKMAFGGKLTLIGIAIVFILLSILVIILEVMQKVNDNLAKRPPREKKSLKDLLKKKKEEPVAEVEKPVENVVVEESVKEEFDDSTIAAIMGALSVVLSEEGENSTFVVKKIKKLSFRR